MGQARAAPASNDLQQPKRSFYCRQARSGGPYWQCRAPAKSRFVQFVPPAAQAPVAGRSSSPVTSRERDWIPTRTFRYFDGALTGNERPAILPPPLGASGG